METKWINQDQDSLLDDLIRTCNELHNTSRQTSSQALSPSVSHGYSGPLRWQHTCDQTIAMPREKVTFHLELNTTSSADFDDVFRVRLHRKLPESLIFDRLVSVSIDGRTSHPTNHSLSRTLDLAFNRIAAGSSVVLVYQARVRFNAEPTSILLDELNMQWSWVSRSRKLLAHNKHLPLPAKHVVTSPVTAKSLQPL